MTTPAQIAELRALMAKAVDPTLRTASLKDELYDYIVVINAMEALYEHGDALLATIDALTAERDHWKANHDNQVRVKQSILDRPDLQDRAKKVQDIIAERDRYRVALETIREWKVPMVFDEKNERDVSLGALLGSNGVRDHFRGVALIALTPPAEGGTKP